MTAGASDLDLYLITTLLAYLCVQSEVSNEFRFFVVAIFVD